MYKQDQGQKAPSAAGPWMENIFEPKKGSDNHVTSLKKINTMFLLINVQQVLESDAVWCLSYEGDVTSYPLGGRIVRRPRMAGVKEIFNAQKVREMQKTTLLDQTSVIYRTVNLQTPS